MTVRLQLLAPALTHARRRGVLGGDEPLDAHGERDARASRGSLWSGTPAVCSPATACRQSAQLLGMTPTQDPGLRDWDLGGWAGTSLDTIAVEHPDQLRAWAQDPDFADHGGESLAQLLARAQDWLSGVEATVNGPLLVIAPTAVIRAVVVTVLDVPATTFWRMDVEPLACVGMSLRAGRRAVRWAAAHQKG
jgi:broad specificity phosphatase PhoE